jgi:hypothetical protein
MQFFMVRVRLQDTEIAMLVVSPYAVDVMNLGPCRQGMTENLLDDHNVLMNVPSLAAMVQHTDIAAVAVHVASTRPR